MKILDRYCKVKCTVRYAYVLYFISYIGFRYQSKISYIEN